MSLTEPAWMPLAKADLGLKEIVGRVHEAKVVQYFADVGHSWVTDDETAWCAAFVGSALERAGFHSTRALNARSYLEWGMLLEKPVPGCIVVFKRGDSAWQGHVAFYVGETKTKVKVLGGNQSNAVRVSSYPKAKLLGYRWPTAAEIKSAVIMDVIKKPLNIGYLSAVLAAIAAAVAAFLKIKGVW